MILANEWANLVGDEVLAADTTKMQITNTYATQSKIAKDATLTLNDKTELEMQEALDAVGLTYDAHIANPTATTADVITLDKSDINVVAYNEGKGHRRHTPDRRSSDPESGGRWCSPDRH